jgi:hypothetical protein
MAPKVDERLSALHPQMLRAGGESDPQELGKRVIGRALETALTRSNLTKQEAAFAMKYSDSAVIGRWIQGTETPQFAKLWTLGDVFRREFVIALAECANGVEIKTIVEIRRTA